MANVDNTHNKQTQNDEIDLHQLWDVLNFNKYKIIAAGGVGLLLAIIYLILATPVYKATALVQVNSENSGSILGGAAGLLGGGMGSNKSDVEISLIKSRLVLGETVDELQTNLLIEYDELPLVGQLFREEIAVKDALEVSQFVVPEVFENVEFLFENIDGKKFRIHVPQSREGKPAPIETIEGVIGRVVTVAGITINVKSINAKAGQKFTLVKQSKLSAIGALNANLVAADVGRDTGILSLSFEGTDKTQIKNVLNSVVTNYMKQDQDFGVLSAQKSLIFIEKQLPITKDSLEAAENRLNDFRHKNATLDLSTEAQSVLTNVTKVESDLTALATKEAELAELFTKEHPNYQALLQQRKILLEAKDDLTKRIASMPQLQQEIIRLTRDVSTEEQVYMQLLSKKQEFSILQASSSGKVRIVDHGVTLEEPVKPRKPLVLFLLTAGFAALASLFFILKSLFNRTITDSHVFNKLGVDLLASIPLSVLQKNKDTTFNKLKSNHQKSARTDYLLAHNMPTDPSVEAIRALRTSVYFMAMEAKNNILMISGATSGLGKSFVSVNLSVVIAQSAKKILLIDADMRNGYLHTMLKQPLGEGFSDVLSKKISIEKAIRSTEIAGLDFISRGQLPANPAELLIGSDINKIFKDITGQYDYIIVDVPPIMAVTDAALIGQHAGTTLIVARYGLTTEQDIENTVLRFANSNVMVKGAILNGVEKSASNQYVYEAYNNYQSRT